MKIKGIILVLILIVSCSSRQLKLEQYANHPVKFSSQKVNYPNDFTLYIPKNWFWKVEDFDNENILFGIDAGSEPDKDGYVNLISIQKSKGLGKDLESEYEYWLDLLKNKPQSGKIIETGETNIFKQNAYFFHLKSDTGTYGESEMITFILESETKGVFYHLAASASQTKDLKKNMAIIIQSLRTFKTTE